MQIGGIIGSSLAPWLGVERFEFHDDGIPPSAVTWFHWFNLPWTTGIATGAILAFGPHFPHLTQGYIIAGLVGSATISAGALALNELSSPFSSLRATQVGQSMSIIVAVATRRALGWTLMAMIALPWLSPHDLRLNWLTLALPASYAGRSLWEPWWLIVSWRLSQSLAQRHT